MIYVANIMANLSRTSITKPKRDKMSTTMKVGWDEPGCCQLTFLNLLFYKTSDCISSHTGTVERIMVYLYWIGEQCVFCLFRIIDYSIFMNIPDFNQQNGCRLIIKSRRRLSGRTDMPFNYPVDVCVCTWTVGKHVKFVPGKQMANRFPPVFVAHRNCRP